MLDDAHQRAHVDEREQVEAQTRILPNGAEIIKVEWGVTFERNGTPGIRPFETEQAALEHQAVSGGDLVHQTLYVHKPAPMTGDPIVLSPEDGIIDPVAVAMAVQGTYKIRLTPRERAEADRQLLALTELPQPRQMNSDQG